MARPMTHPLRSAHLADETVVGPKMIVRFDDGLAGAATASPTSCESQSPGPYFAPR
ncbi:hypothetical protein ABR737_11540 [Streptomyces sp. Edi2]|uniref:hypothetical protein n=1 Tax=Streptomyces sp. Edi2 TaxID=3162528 RepID=UPI0033059146